jgi:hypothetical protein
MYESEYDGLADWEKELLGEYMYVTTDEPVAPLVGSVAPAASAPTAPKFKYCNITPIDEPASVFEFFFNEGQTFSITVIEKSQRRAETFIANQLHVDGEKPQLISQRPAIRADFDDPELKVF